MVDGEMGSITNKAAEAFRNTLAVAMKDGNELALKNIVADAVKQKEEGNLQPIGIIEEMDVDIDEALSFEG